MTVELRYLDDDRPELYVQQKPIKLQFLCLSACTSYEERRKVAVGEKQGRTRERPW